MKKIFVSSHSFSKSDELKNYAVKNLSNFEITFNPLGRTLSRDEVKQYARDADTLLVGHEAVDRDLFLSLPKLSTIAKYGVGLDNIKLNDCKELVKKILYVPGVNASYVAEHTLGLAITLMRNLYDQMSLLKNGHWKRDGGYSLRHKKVAIIGVGHVGSQAAKLFTHFGSHVLGVDLLDKKSFLDSIGAKQVDFSEAISTADIISLHVPLTDKTSKMMDSNTIKKLKKPNYIINTSRGSVIDEDDLLIELNSPNSSISGVAFDVFENEPTPNQGLVSHPRVICTPHIAANCAEAKWAMGSSIIDKIKQNN